ncbi:hypothetical protein BC834DRAFT_875947 [Gloeopeniophorella convolvens]|nr:hypothetical protein BC834DRAFT_875947 [Gloeopeniophorella convolvens]
MRIPFYSSPPSPLARRKGGGGKGGGSSGGLKGNKGTGSSGTSGAGRTNVPVRGLPAGRTSATAYGNGGGKQITIPAGSPFAGRTAGGGTREQVFGTNVYGSGYPGAPSRGVSGLGFPFFFWPAVWGGAATGSASYLHDEGEYGAPDNSSRPGGPMAQAQFQSNSTNTTFHILADNSTVASLITSIKANCSSDLSNSGTSTTPSPYTENTTSPRPEQAIQYYRASSVALTLDGYNNTAALGNGSTPNVPLPSGVDTKLLDCLNNTIGEAVPLVDGALRWGPPKVNALVLAWLVVLCIHSIF